MKKKHVVIVGAGFAGLSAVKSFSNHKHMADITLINKYESSHFRPLIPDVVSGRVQGKYLLSPLLQLKDKYEFTLFCEPVINIDFSENEITLSEHNIKYDYLIFTAGSQTVFPPKGSFRHYALRLDTVHDANRVKDTLQSEKYDHIVVCGGGYTGVEIAANIQQFIKESGKAKQVIVAEMVDQLVSSLPEWMRLYVLKNLTEMGIEVRLSSKVVDLNENDVVLSTGEQIKNALCIWTTGLEASTLARELDIEKAKNGRINVDPMLRFKENCFAAGDAACFKKNNQILRMSVQHALDQGRIAAENTIALISGNPLKKFVSYDPGYIIPLSEGRSCGEVFGLPVKGKVATALHYLLSMYRSTGVYNKLGIAKGSIKAF